jgi:DNA-directed RNA polymerase II subunit RPB1
MNTNSLRSSTLQSNKELKKIKQVQFGVFGYKEILRYSVTSNGINTTDLNVQSSSGPKPNSLYDKKMGGGLRQDSGYTCETCGHEDGYFDIITDSEARCPGHFGHIDMRYCPVYHTGYYKTVIKVLQCFCWGCGRLKLDLTHPKMIEARNKRGAARLKCVYDACKGVHRRCGGDKRRRDEDDLRDQLVSSGCGKPFPNVINMTGRNDKPGTVVIQVEEFNEGDDRDVGGFKRQLYAKEALDALYKLETDLSRLEILGFDHRYTRPSWMIIQVLPVPPPQVRPLVISPEGNSEDDLTYKLVQIVQLVKSHNDDLEKGSTKMQLDKYIDKLQFHVTTYFNNEFFPTFFDQHKVSYKRLKGIRERIKGKEGRVRGNLMGKRVDFSARSVISADPNLQVDQLGVPPFVAEKMSIPQTVTPLCKADLQRLVRSTRYPGAREIQKKDGQVKNLTLMKNAGDQLLDLGDRVSRHVLDNDPVIFNRQPTLHKMSMMGHRVRVLPYSSFRLNLSVTTPYNADFDGDEMNMHVPQTAETATEIKEIMMVPLCIMTPQSNSPVMGIVQDTLLASRIMTRRDVFIERDVMMNIMMCVPGWDGKMPTPAILKPKVLWTGKQLWSYAIKSSSANSFVNYQRRAQCENEENDWETLNPHNALMSVYDTNCIVHDSDLLVGMADKKSLGSKTQGTLIDIIWKDQGPEAAKMFISNVQLIANYWLLQNSFTIGTGDLIALPAVKVKARDAIQKCISQVSKIVSTWQDGTLEGVPGHNMHESFEMNVNKALNEAQSVSGSILRKEMDLDLNRMNQMARAGSKGTDINLYSVMCLVGQQNVDGKRIKHGFRHRSLPHFPKYDLGAHSRGFVGNSYMDGLTPQEFFFHAMGGREGVIDTAIKTSQTGYIQRRLIKSMEDLIVRYDGTVRSSVGIVVQFLYGEDGMDATHLEMYDHPKFIMTKEQHENEYKLDPLSPNFGYDEERQTSYISSEKLNGISQVQRMDMQRLCQQELEILEQDRHAQESIWRGVKSLSTRRRAAEFKLYLPVNVSRLISIARQQMSITDNDTTDLLPDTVITQVRKLCSELVVVRGSDLLSLEAQQNATKMLQIVMRSELASKKVLLKHRLTSSAFEMVLGEIRKRFNKAHVSAGEAVGVIAAQSLGEPTTQMTLNTFHNAGNSAKNVTLGVPRLNEIISVARVILTPTMTVYLHPEHARDKKMAASLTNEFARLTIGDILQSVEIFYDPDPLRTCIKEDESLVDDHFLIQENEALEEFTKDLLPWILRLKFSTDMINRKDLKIEQIKRTLEEVVEKNFTQIIFCDNMADADGIRARIRVKDTRQDQGDQEEEEGTIAKMLRNLSEFYSATPLCGIEGISRVFLPSDASYTEAAKPWGASFVEKNMKKKKKKEGVPFNPNEHFEEEYLLDLEGTALQTILGLKIVDNVNTTTNHVVEVCDVLGIEAARGALYMEIDAVISFNRWRFALDLSLNSRISLKVCIFNAISC